MLIIIITSIVFIAIAVGVTMVLILRKRQKGVIELREEELPKIIPDEEQKEKLKESESNDKIDFA